MLVVFLAFGATCTWLFHEGLYLPILASCAAMGLIAVHLHRMHKRSRVGPMTLLLFIVYALPFIHVIPYIWFDFDAQTPAKMWGIAVNPYMLDKPTIELMAMIGACGAAGFAAGAAFLHGRMTTALPLDDVLRFRAAEKTMPLPVFIVWVVVSIVLTWISAPAEMLFTAGYGESAAIQKDWNFSSAWMISYAFLVFALADSMFEASFKIGRLKRKILLYATLLIVIWFQLLRGDRESLPLILAAILMYFVWGKSLLDPTKVRVKLSRPKLALLGLVVFVAAYFVGALRHSLTEVSDSSQLLDAISDTGVDSFDNAISGTWSAVLLTPLSIAGDYERGSLSLAFGQTYVDLLGSTIPGFVADWIGYVRPIDAMRGPAWEMTYGQGGTHAVVVPFINFRMGGVFMIVALWSLLFAKLERYTVRHLSVSNLALLGVVAMAVPHWLWYGEKNIMTALIVWLVLAVLHRFSKSNSARLVLPPSPPLAA